MDFHRNQHEILMTRIDPTEFSLGGWVPPDDNGGGSPPSPQIIDVESIGLPAQRNYAVRGPARQLTPAEDRLVEEVIDSRPSPLLDAPTQAATPQAPHNFIDLDNGFVVTTDGAAAILPDDVIKLKNMALRAIARKLSSDARLLRQAVKHAEMHGMQQGGGDVQAVPDVPGAAQIEIHFPTGDGLSE